MTIQSDIPNDQHRILRKQEARQLSPEETLSPLDLIAIFDKAIEKAKLLPRETQQECLEYEYIMGMIAEAASLRSKQLLDIVRWLNEKLPENPIIIPSEKYLGRKIGAMQRQPLPKSEVLIGDEGNILLTEGARVCIYSKPKAAKTCLSLQLAMDLAAGGNFLGRYKARIPHNVLYLNFELDEALFEERILQIKSKLGYEDVPGFRQITLLGNEIPLLDTKEGYDQLRGILETLRSDEFPVEVMILDCRWKTFLKSDNEGDVMRTWLSNVESLQKEFQFIPVIIHHEGKATIGMGSGSSNFDRWVNTAIQIKASQNRDEQQEPTSALPPRRRLSIVGNYSGFFDIETIFEYPIHKLYEGQTWGGRAKKISLAAEFILKTLSEHGQQIEQEVLKGLADQEGITEDSFKRALNHLEASNQITRQNDPNRPGNHNIIKLVVVVVEEASHS